MNFSEFEKMVDYIIMDCRIKHQDNFISLNDVIEHRLKILLNSE